MYKEKIDQMIMQSMKEHDKTKTKVYRALKTAFINFQSAKKAKELDVVNEQLIIDKMIEERKASEEIYSNNDRMDLSVIELKERLILNELLLPRPGIVKILSTIIKICYESHYIDDNSDKLDKKYKGDVIRQTKIVLPLADNKTIVSCINNLIK